MFDEKPTKEDKALVKAAKETRNTTVCIHTTLGDIHVELYSDMCVGLIISSIFCSCLLSDRVNVPFGGLVSFSVHCFVPS